MRLLAVALGLVSGGAFLTHPSGDAHADEFKKGPYLQSVGADRVTVMWESDTLTAGKVIVSSPTRPDVVVHETTPTRLHEVLVTGLEPGRRYAYAVESGGERATGEVATAPRPGEAFSFVVFGDTRSNAGAHKNVVERVRREVPDFILLTGDMVNEGAKADEWQEFFDIERDLLRDNAVFPAIGNHDREPRPARTAENYRKYFSVPDDSPDPERYYAFTYGNARFLVLDSNLYSFALTDQTAWIERELQAAVKDRDIDHIFVVMHHPPFSTSIHGGHSELREMWTPLFEKYGVGAVFSGHDHTYEHCENNGVKYLVSGGGGAPLYPKDPKASPVDKAASRYFERTFNFLRINVVGEFVEVAAVREDGTLIEAYSWGRRPVIEPLAVAPPAAKPERSEPAAALGSSAVTQAASRGGGCAAGGGAGGAWAGLLVLAALAGLGRRRRTRS